MNATEAAERAWAEEQEIRARQREEHYQRAVARATQWWSSVFGEPGADVYVIPSGMTRPGWPAVHALARDGLLLEFPLPVPWSSDGPYVIVRCPTCREQAPSALGRPVVTLADVGQALAAGAGPHRRPIDGREGATQPCEGGPPEAEAPEPSTGEMLHTVLEALVRDVVADVLAERTQ